VISAHHGAPRSLKGSGTNQAEAIDRIEVGRRVTGPVRIAFRVGDSEATAERRHAADALQHPRVTRTRFNGWMAVDAATWDDLIEGEELAHVEGIPPAASRTSPLPKELHPRLREALPFDELYVHQRAAYDAAARGEHLILATGTASGKSLAFNLPVLDAIARDPKNRALYLYPTKALAQDQARALAELRAPGVRAAIYDGDTPSERRWQIRKWANVILTNPDMLHVGVLPHHDRWADVLHNLRYIVIDEAHVYRGVFGSHVGNVLRRLRRLARVYGADPQLLFASATIANPGELALGLAGTKATVVADDAAPRAERTVVLWNPELLDAELGLRASALGDASRLMAGLVSRGLRTICFTKSRKSAELIHRFTADRVDAETAARLAPYRAGYTPAQRRNIERRLVEGELLGVSATDALELGIDIGLLDCAISVGFPGTVASLRQQWGRAGRRGHGLAVLVASQDALDQYFMREPETLLGRRVEAAILDHANPRVLDGHVRAAAFEAPLDDADRATLGDEALERAALLPELKKTKSGYVWAGRDYPAGRFGLRSTTPDTFSIVEARSGTILGIAERERAYSTVHEGAVYLHLGESYLVRELDLQARTAVVTPYKGDYYTQAKKETDTAIEETLRTGRRCGLELSFGRISVTERVVAYQKKSVRDQSTLETVALDLPETNFETEAIWYVPELEQLEGLEQMPKLLGTLHAAEHSMIALLPLWAMCDRWDIGGLSTNIHFQTNRPTVFIYDGHPGGVGITERGFDAFEGWVEDTARMLEGCPCADGCPSCVQSPKCGNLNEMLDKDGALTFLRRLVAASTSES
jgi:DEAD/DEAH box helicase domain-containing protein